MLTENKKQPLNYDLDKTFYNDTTIQIWSSPSRES